MRARPWWCAASLTHGVVWCVRAPPSASRAVLPVEDTRRYGHPPEVHGRFRQMRLLASWAHSPCSLGVLWCWVCPAQVVPMEEFNLHVRKQTPLCAPPPLPQ